MNQPELLGDRLLRGDLVYLDVLEREDMETVGPWWRSLDLLQYVSNLAIQPQSMSDEMHWFDEVRKKGDNIGFAIKRLDTAAIIGGVSVGTFNWRARHGCFGISIGERSAWGKGYGTDATRVMLRYCFHELNLNRVWLRVFGYNERAMSSYQKCGFSVEGRLREHVYRDGKYWDEVIMGVLRREWEANQEREAAE